MMRFISKKDIKIIGYYLGFVSIIISFILLVPMIINIFTPNNNNNNLAFIVPVVIALGLGLLLRKIGLNGDLDLKIAMIISALCWIWASVITALVYYLYGDFNIVDSLFESVSCWTTSGFTAYTDLSTVTDSILFLRAFTQWIGGLGLLTIFMLVISKRTTNLSRLYNSEARNEKTNPSLKNTLKNIIIIYVILTVIGIIMFSLAGMPLFESICNTFAQISTGGIPVRNGGMAYYNKPVYNIISIVIMILGATNFLTVYNAVKSKGKSFIKDYQFIIMIGLIGLSIVFIWLRSKYPLPNVIYDSVSAITTTGTALEASQSTIPDFMKFMLVILMIIGGGSASTAGGIKINRIVVFFKGLYSYIISGIFPDKMDNIKLNGQHIEKSLLNNVNYFILLYFLFLFIGTFVLIFMNYKPIDALFDVCSAQGGVGLSTISNINEYGKIMLIINMLLGRLEIIPFLVLIFSGYNIVRNKIRKGIKEF